MMNLFTITRYNSNVKEDNHDFVPDGRRSTLLRHNDILQTFIPIISQCSSGRGNCDHVTSSLAGWSRYMTMSSSKCNQCQCEFSWWSPIIFCELSCCIFSKIEEFGHDSDGFSSIENQFSALSGTPPQKAIISAALSHIVLDNDKKVNPTGYYFVMWKMLIVKR